MYIAIVNYSYLCRNGPTNPMMSWSIRSWQGRTKWKTSALLNIPHVRKRLSNHLISNTSPPHLQNLHFLPKSLLYHSTYSIILSKLTSTYIITITMSFLTTIRASSRQAIRTNFAVPASTFHSSAVRGLNEDDRSQYNINLSTKPY